MDASEGIEELSEKECEALRLLLAGHDAKSSARALGVTHHAINDRLRSARRKLGVSSSREAALVLAEAEGATPEPFVHSPLGAAPDRPADDDGSDASSKQRPFRWLSMRRKGTIIMMSITLAAIAVASFVVSGEKETVADGDTHPVEAVSPARAQSSASALDFMAKIDAGLAKAAYDAATPRFRDTYSFDMWELGVLMHKAEGGAQRRTLVAVERDGEVADARYDEIEILIFDTVMLDGERKTERLVMARMGRAWKVAKIDVTDHGEQ